MTVDLVLRGGTICDGTGLPSRTGDVVVHEGRILGTGLFDGRARREIDVAGCIVAPGFVDVHTHYDAQVTWDRLCTPSPWHGVTTVVLGNCGFGLAPCPSSRRDSLLRMLEHVEGMPYASLCAGVVWEWETFPQYLEALRRRPLGPNVGVLLGHSPLRADVLGDAAYERTATGDEIARMQDAVRQAMAAGALGLATSRSPGHVGEGGRPVPSRRADRAELASLVAAMAESGRGVLEITPETFPLSTDELAFLQELSRASRRPVSFSAILDLPDREGVWDGVLADLRRGRESGAQVHPQVSCRPMRFDFDLETGCASLDVLPCWRRFRGAGSTAERLALLAEAEFRETFRREALGRPESPSAKRWASAVLEHATRPEHASLVGRTLSEIARERGGDEADALLDLSRAEELKARFSMTLLNFDEERVGALLREPEALIALSDAGAHVSILCDAGYATHLLGYWVRERGLFSWEEAVRRLSAMPARIYGIPDRGRLVPGAVADVTCFDPERVAMRRPERVRDFPADTERYVVRADGIELVLVGGRELVVAGETTDERPGAVVAPAGSS
ncbi:MAG: amidohydrolase family protein [Deltaproteobacteria bacterium]|nr:amidohydrolase family protein [Deltaproteobacteria bacterium]